MAVGLWWVAMLVGWAGDGRAEQAPASAPPPAEPSQVPEQWQQLGVLFLELLDQRIGDQLSRNVEPMIRQRLQETLSAVDERLAGFGQQLQETARGLSGRVDELAGTTASLVERVQALAREQESLYAANQRLQAQLESAVTEIGALRVQAEAARAEVERQRAEVRRLQGALDDLSRRFWIVAVIAVAGVLVR